MSEKVRRHSREAFARRLARLTRLFELDAPDVILQRETRLLARSAEGLDIPTWHELIAEEAIVAAKRSLRLCLTDGCEEPMSEERDDGHCVAHGLEFDAQEEEEEEEEEENNDDDSEETAS